MQIAVMSDSHDHLENLRKALSLIKKNQTGDTFILNPGEIMGKDGDPGFCLVDTETREVRRIRL